MTYADQAYQGILRRIQTGELRQGDRLTEDRIAEGLGMSRTPVREALNRLVSRGLVEVSLGRTLAIRRLERAQVIELYEMRQILEGAAARLAAKHASKAEIYSLENLLERTRPENGKIAFSPDAMARLNTEFHDGILQASHNRYLQDQSEQLRESLWLLAGTTFSVKGRSKAAYGEHALILQAIAAGDESVAEEVARQHIERSLEARLTMDS
ncbi:MAG TPA: GntR family transcriptional regulator [Burkholderiales bacterium]|nr:GntR family transcriptional regulator [Burkholderiales bacterium]